jgi:hypothetical protein
MPAQNRHQKAPDSSETGGFPRKEGSEYERGRQEAIAEAEEKRKFEAKEAVEKRVREDEVRHAHAHTPYFEYDNATYEDKTVESGSRNDQKKHKPKK